MKKSSLADEMKKKARRGKLRNEKSDNVFRKHEEDCLADMNKVAAKEARQLLPEAIKEIKEFADGGKDGLVFLVHSSDSPSKETETKQPMVARHLASLLENKSFKVQPICHISEEYVDSPRRIYVAVEISWKE